MVTYIQTQKELPEKFWELTSEFNKWVVRVILSKISWPRRKAVGFLWTSIKLDSTKCERKPILASHKACTWAPSHHASRRTGTSPPMKAHMEIPAAGMLCQKAVRFGSQAHYAKEELLPPKISMHCSWEKSEVKLWVKYLYFHIRFRIFPLPSWMFKTI